MLYLNQGRLPKDDFFISPLTRLAHTIRNETAKNGDQSIADPFADLDFDSFPDDLKTKMQGAKDAFDQTVQQNVQLEQARLQTEQWGRQQQSRAAKLEAERNKGNLSPDDQLFNNFKDKFVEMGLTEEIAIAQAKIQVATVKVSEERIGRGLAPLVQSTAGNEAYRLMAQMPVDKYSSVPEIQDVFKKHVESLVDTGGSVTPATLETLKNMAIGAYVVRNGDVAAGSGAVSSPADINLQREKSLPKLNDDTARALAITFAAMGIKEPAKK